MNQTTKKGHLFSIIFISLVIFSLSFTGCTTKQEAAEDTSIREIKPMEFKKHVDVASSSITYYDKNSELYASQTSTIQESDDPFRIVDHGPAEELPVEVRNPTIYVLFSQPVVPLAKLGDVMTTSEIMSISPPVPGIYRWYGSKILSFEPSEKYLPQREYRVSIQKSLKSLGGKTLTGETSFRFHTEYLKIVDFYPGSPYEGYSFSDVPLAEAKKITLTFSYPVSIDVIKKYITLTSKGKKYNFTLARPQNPDELDENYILRTIVLYVDEDFESDAEVIVTLGKGARSEVDFIGTPEEIRRTFHTITPFVYKEYSSYSYSFPRSEKGDANPVYLEFSHSVDKESVKANISLSLEVQNLQENIEVWGNYVKLTNLPVTYGGFYTIDMGKKMRDVYGRELGKQYSVKITVSDASTYYYFPHYGTRMLESSFEPKIIFEHQNIFDGVWRVDRIDDPYSSFSSESLGIYDFSYAKKNVKHYRILSLRPWLNEEKKGFVGISWNFQEKRKDGTRPSWGQYNLQVQVTDLGITTRYGYNKIIVMVASLSSGKPVKGARVLLDTRDSLSLYEYTDKNGMAVFSFQDGEYVRYFTTNSTVTQPRIIVENGTDKIIFIPNTSHDQYHFGIYNTTTINHVEKSTMKAFLYTDRGLYKPGETITYSGIDRTL
ncbi:MAG: Ig-like domain-containing protein, partial [Spirochaetales bacterium]|nr:Ig-like domain-containing protein [Spirochaetales bacterium]